MKLGVINSLQSCWVRHSILITRDVVQSILYCCWLLLYIMHIKILSHIIWLLSRWHTIKFIAKVIVGVILKCCLEASVTVTSQPGEI
jgi:hypothetical protein